MVAQWEENDSNCNVASFLMEILCPSSWHIVRAKVFVFFFFSQTFALAREWLHNGGEGRTEIGDQGMLGMSMQCPSSWHIVIIIIMTTRVAQVVASGW